MSLTSHPSSSSPRISFPTGFVPRGEADRLLLCHSDPGGSLFCHPIPSIPIPSLHFTCPLAQQQLLRGSRIRESSSRVLHLPPTFGGPAAAIFFSSNPPEKKEKKKGNKSIKKRRWPYLSTSTAIFYPFSLFSSSSPSPPFPPPPSSSQQQQLQ